MSFHNILLTGGAGYIGSHIYLSLYNKGYKPIILDNFSRSNLQIIGNIKKITKEDVIYENCDLRNTEKVIDLLNKYKISTVVHLAAFKSIDESVLEPLLYYDNNINSLISLLSALKKSNCKNLIFSSSASLYKQNKNDDYSYSEKDPIECINPYSETKLICEKIITDYSKSNQLNYIILRYFNPAGSHESNLISEMSDDSPKNLFPYIMKVLLNIQPYLRVFGDNYNTIDGSGVRDYIHIDDLVEGHISALLKLNEKNMNTIINLGSGVGFSVFEVIKSFEKVSKKTINYKVLPRRNGDKASIYANIKFAEDTLKWKPKRTLLDICSSCWKSEKNKL